MKGTVVVPRDPLENTVRKTHYSMVRNTARLLPALTTTPLLLLVLFAPPAKGQPLILKSATQTVSLSGTWRAISTSSEALPPDSAKWVEVTLPMDKAAIKRVYRSSHLWLSREIRLPENTPPGSRLGIAFVPFAAAVEAFANGQPMGTVGKMPPNEPNVPFFLPRAFAVPPEATRAGRFTLTLRVWQIPTFKVLGTNSPVGRGLFLVGPLEEIRVVVAKRSGHSMGMAQMRLVFLMILFGAGAVLFLWLFLRRREQTELLPFAVICLSVVLIGLLSLLAFMEILDLMVAIRLMPAAGLLHLLALPEFLSRLLLSRPPGKVLRGFQVYSLASMLPIMVVGPYFETSLVLIFPLLITASYIGIGLWVIALAFRGNREARTIAVGVFAVVVVDLYTTLRPATLFPVGWIGWLLLLFAMAASIAQRVVRSRDELDASHRAAIRFVPKGFLHTLGRERLQEVTYGEARQQVMTVLFSDIRGFTTLSERLGPEETFAFLNGYLGHMQPLIHEHRGFVASYLGDGIMALFPETADDAVAACVAMASALRAHGGELEAKAGAPVAAGMGLHTGPLMLGTIGGLERMDCTVIGDTVNLASRVESLTKRYGAALLLTGETVSALKDPAMWNLREVDRVQVKGKDLPVTLYEVLDALPTIHRDTRLASSDLFSQGVDAYRQGRFPEAEMLFARLTDSDPGDGAAQTLRDRCAELVEAPPVDWEGVTRLHEK